MVILLCIKASSFFLKDCLFLKSCGCGYANWKQTLIQMKVKKYNSTQRLWPGAPSFRCLSPLLSEGWVVGSLVADSRDERWEPWMLDGFNTSVNGFKAGSRRDMTLGGCPQPCILVIGESLARTWGGSAILLPNWILFGDLWSEHGHLVENPSKIECQKKKPG